MADKMKALLDGLNQDLANELGTAILYTWQTAVAPGFDGEELREFLRPEVSGEMGHATFLADKIVALGGIPTMEPTKYESPKDVKGMLKYDLKLEREAVASYAERVKQAEEVGEYGLKVKLEEIIADETTHAERMELILKGL